MKCLQNNPMPPRLPRGTECRLCSLLGEGWCGWSWEAADLSCGEGGVGLVTPAAGQCSGMVVTACFPKAASAGVFGDGISGGGCLFRWKGEQCWRSVSGPTWRLRGAVGVVFLQTGGFQQLCRGAGGSEGDPERPCWRERCCFTASCRESTSPYLF